MPSPVAVIRPIVRLLLCLLLTGGGTQAQDVPNASSPSSVLLPRSISLPASRDSRQATIQPKGIPEQVTLTDLRCVSDAFELPGQSWSAGLSSGGITLKAGSVAVPMNKTITPQERAMQLNMNRTVAPGMVTLLVIDDFQPVPVELDEDGPGRQSPIKYQLRHGELVLAHIRSLLQGAGFTVSADRAVRAGRTIVFRKLDIGLVKIDPAKKRVIEGQGGVSTEQIVDAFRQQGKEWKLASSEALVINMSFALIPSNLQSVYVQYRDAALDRQPPLRLTFSAFLQAVADANLPAGTADQKKKYLEDLFTSLRADDPLLTTVRGLLQGRAALAVASSGNYAQTFETMPAAWPPSPLPGPPVLGVGATDKKGVPLNWSDTSDVLEVGEWFRFSSLPQGAGCLVGTTCIFAVKPPYSTVQPRTTNFAYKGTSFSSPTVAAALASRMPLTPGAVGTDDPCFEVDLNGFLHLRRAPGQPAMPKLREFDFKTLFRRCN